MKHLRASSLVVAAVGSVLVTMSSMYVALRMGALPWPTVFAALFAMFILKPLRGSLHDINVAHTGVSAGGLVAGGLAFTIPAAWLVGKDISFTKILISASIGALIGVWMTVSTRKKYVEELNLPFPMGIAAYDTIKAGDEGGKKAKILFTSMAMSALFTYLRDGLRVIPVVYKNFGMFPMAVGIGFLIGVIPTMSWLSGGIIQLIFNTPWMRDFGLGMMIGGGLAMAILGSSKGKITLQRTDLIVGVVGFASFLAMGMSFIPSIVAAAFAVLVVHMAGVVDGTTGIDPMEVFAIIVISIVGLIYKLDITTAVMLSGVIAVSTGLAGDSLQDMKTGKLLGTNPRAQLISEAIGASVGVVTATTLLYLIHSKYGSSAFGSYFPVPQAAAVSKFLGGGALTKATIWGIVTAFILQILKLPALTFGIGLYLPLFITLPVALGGALRLLVDKTRPRNVEAWSVAASGLLGGEGLVGIIIGLVKPL